jgi:cytoskeletal protein RodZ
MGEERSVAAQLRRAREEQGKTLEQVHQQTGLSLHVLQSLEAGNFTVVEPVYVRLALRAYAESLGLEADRLVGRLKFAG